MTTPTPNIALARPDDGDTDWGTEYRAAMDTLDVLFDGTTGNHDHSGVDGHGPSLPQGSVTGLTAALAAKAAAADLTAHAALTAAHGATGAVVGTTNSQTLTNKTLTSPVVNTPTGIVKADVGLGNVDNTSDATKNAAAVTLTNKTLTTPTIGSLANATHDHTNAAGGGTLDAAAIAAGTIAQARLGSGSGGAGTKVLYDDQTFKTPASGGMTNPMTTAADLIVGDTGGAAIRLAKGTDGQVLTVDPTTHLLVWATPSGGGTGDVVGPASAVASEIALFDGTTGKLLKRATTTGLLKAASGVIAAATANTDYATPNQDTTGKAAKADALNSATTVVNVASATAPTSGQVLTATGGTAATWQTPSGGSALTVEEVDASPTDSAVTKIVFPNGTLAIAGHEVTYTPAASGATAAQAGATSLYLASICV